MAIPASRKNTRVRIVVGCALIGLFCWQFGREAESGTTPVHHATAVIAPAIALPTPLPKPTISNDDLARTDPLGLLQLALQRYQKSVSDYQCTFTKQERIRGKLGQEQEIQVRFREMPFSVLMEWTRNAGDAKRVLYVQGQWRSGDGEDLAKIEPQSAIARLLVRSVSLPINGSTARAEPPDDRPVRLRQRPEADHRLRSQCHPERPGKPGVRGRGDAAGPPHVDSQTDAAVHG